VKSDRGKEGLFHKIFTKIFYGLISKAVKMDMKNSSDYKLLDRKVIDELAKLKERNTFFRALSFWVGFKKTTVYYEVAERQFGTSKWSTKSLIRYAINNVLCFSYTPLHIITVVGILFILVGAVVGVDALVSFIRGTAANGFPTIIFILLIGFGAVLVCLGIIGVYIAQIYDEVKGRPQYVIGRKIE
jgi:dolichol-phosphate mannosyltransferase